jgi:sirohydrochlorin ferrochelatase
MTPSAPPLVVAAHGSADPRFAEVVSALTALVRERRPSLDVRAGYLEHGPPHLPDVVSPDAVVVPLLLSSGYHVRVDIPRQAPGCVVAGAMGPDPRIATVLARRLREAGWAEDVAVAGRQLAEQLGQPVTVGFVAAGRPRLVDLPAPAAVASYLLAPGQFQDAVARCGAAVVAEPLGAAPELAEVVLDRYDAAVGAAGVSGGEPRR